MFIVNLLKVFVDILDTNLASYRSETNCNNLQIQQELTRDKSFRKWLIIACIINIAYQHISLKIINKQSFLNVREQNKGGYHNKINFKQRWYDKCWII